MRAAVVAEPGQSPCYTTFTDPKPADGTHLITVAAAALTQVTKSRASGGHYSAKGSGAFVPGIDGTGTDEAGRRVYFVMPEAPFGGMAEKTIAQSALCVALPPTLDFVQAAALANPGMSSWAALKERAKFVPGETVLINGATGISGRLAVQIAKYLGARKVIATGRNPAVLAALKPLGADITLELTGDAAALEGKFLEQFEQRVDVVLDYLWGESAEVLLVAAAKAAPEAVPIRFVGIGSVSGPKISLPSAVLRSSALELMGSGINSIPLPRLVNAIDEVLHAAVAGKFAIPLKVVPLAQVAEHWSNNDSSARTVFTIP